MTAGRLLWIEFRRNAGIWFVLPIVAVAWYLLDRTWIWTPFLWSDTDELLQKSLIPFAGPALAGLAAWMAGRDRRRGLDDLLATTSRPAMARRLTLFISTVLWAILAYVIFATYMLTRTTLLATWGRPKLWPILIVLMALLAFSAWGFLAGSLFRSRFTAPLAAIVAFAIEAGFENSSSVMSLSTGSSAQTVQTSNWLNALTPDSLSPFPHWQFLLYVGLTATALAALALIHQRDMARIGALALSVGIVGLSVLMTWGDTASFDYDPATGLSHNGWGQVVHFTSPVQPKPVCAGQPVTVCAHPAWQPVLDQAVRQANTLAAPLLGLPNVPLRVERNETGLSSDRNGDAYLDLLQYADRLVAADSSIPNGYVQNEAQLAIRGWLLQRAGIDSRPNCEDVAANPDTRFDTGAFPGWPTAGSCAATERFAQLAPEMQRSWLETHYTDLRAGKLTLADLP
jgi:hypothetical protein